ncbi:esterase [Kaistia sp. 32K]|uniref:alpha/beta hydrolase n=1 Tax=Kaistia sp. 32K TaxID=2795690 RepID=UPI0019159BB7|nr:alpha/beta hydrolase family protein [Kaistia sp. 32K]BCP54084.1 esterase [Kaistia sp. 32K]
MSNRLTATLGGSLVCAASLIATAHAAPPPHGVVERHQLANSAALGRPVAYTLYRPAGAPAPGTRWPVLYLLHGGGGGADDWLDQGKIAETLDGKIAAGEIRPLVVVMPDGGGESWFVDNPDPGGAGNVEAALTDDLVHAVDQTLPTAACRTGRAVGGLSMGGYGAALFALDHPDRYAAVISLSGAIAPPIDPGDKERIERGQTFYDGAFGNPFDVKRFNADNIFPRVERDKDHADRPAFWLAAGDRDGLGIITGSAALHVALRKAGYETSLRIGPGQHDWNNWSQAIVPALAWLSPKLSDHCDTPTPAAFTGPAKLVPAKPQSGEAQK